MAHELFSYGGGYSGIHKLAKECGRIIRKDGILTYRDPDGIELHSMEEVTFTTPFSRRFLAYFLPKFLDRKYTNLKDKVELGYKDSLMIEMNGSQISIEDLMTLSPETLERCKINLKAKAGLITEIQRHMILFAKSISSIDCSDQENKDKSEDAFKDKITFGVDNNAAVKAIEQFLRDNGIVFTLNKRNFEITAKEKKSKHYQQLTT